MNAVLMMAYNNSEMTRAAIESVFAQTIPTQLIVVNNGSTDGTAEMLGGIDPNGHFSKSIVTYPKNCAPTIVANAQFFGIFKSEDYCLCMANDVVLPASFYEEVLKWPRGIVSASFINDRAAYDDYIKSAMPPVAAVSENTPMAVMLLRRWVYDAVVTKDGHFFDENIFNYCSDCDLALRVAACGIRGVQLNIPYYHVGGASWRTLEPERQRVVHIQAELDRAYFKAKWGFKVDAYEYGACAVDINFRGESKDGMAS